MKYLVLAFLFFLVLACAAEDGHFYCGRRLSEVLARLCWDGETAVKRDAGWWMPNTLTLGGTRGKRGLVDECCMKPCTIDELVTYC